MKQKASFNCIRLPPSYIDYNKARKIFNIQSMMRKNLDGVSFVQLCPGLKPELQRWHPGIFFVVLACQ